MAITDLTGYTWEGKDYDISLTPGPKAQPKNYSLNFRSNNTDYTSISLNPMGFPTKLSEENITYGSTIVYETTDRWKNYAYQTIQITGGTDATNSTLIAWLEANGTLTAPIQANTYNLTHTLTNLTKGNVTLTIAPDSGSTYPSSLSITNGTLVSYDNTTGVAVISGNDTTVVSGECVEDSGITDLTGTSWEITDAPDMLGYDEDGYGLTYYINFLSNNTSYSNISNTDQIERWQKLYYNGPSNAVYSRRTGWSDDNYRIIEITGGTDATNSDLIAWLEANATQIS